jgi:putative colanic acid biosynthesis UDP-glucose lipid carrier transferase
MPRNLRNTGSRQHLSFAVLLTQAADIVSISCVAMLLYLTIPLEGSSLREYAYLTVVAVLLTGIVFTQLGLYREYPVARGATLPGWLLVLLLLTLFLFITKTSDHFSRLWYGLWMLVGFITIEFGRFIVRRVIRSVRRAGFSRRKVVIIGCSDIGVVALERLTNIDETGFEVVGYFSDDEGANQLHGWKGKISEAKQFVEEGAVDQLWLAFPFNQADKLEQVLEDFVHSLVDVRLVPDLYGFRLLNHSTSVVNGLPVVNLSMTPMDGLNRFVKAVEDKVFASIILLGISPWLVLIALGVKLSSRGPVFYRQERMSWNGGCFYMYKFRTMSTDAESETGAVWAIQGDARATRFGSFLRRTSLDELPQFFNVLKGDMSIVGPRPERPFFVEKFKNEVPGYMQKHKVKAGITGWAQVNGWRGDTDLTARIEHDLYYIEHWSLLFDLKIILLTLFRGLVHKNAY